MSTADEVTMFTLDMDGSMVPDADGEWVRAEAYFALEAKRFTVPAGYVLVPLAPTSEMIKAGDAFQYVGNTYIAMLAARPEVTP